MSAYLPESEDEARSAALMRWQRETGKWWAPELDADDSPVLYPSETLKAPPLRIPAKGLLEMFVLGAESGSIVLEKCLEENGYLCEAVVTDRRLILVAKGRQRRGLGTKRVLNKVARGLDKASRVGEFVTGDFKGRLMGSDPFGSDVALPASSVSIPLVLLNRVHTLRENMVGAGFSYVQRDARFWPLQSWVINPSRDAGAALDVAASIWARVDAAKQELVYPWILEEQRGDLERFYANKPTLGMSPFSVFRVNRFNPDQRPVREMPFEADGSILPVPQTSPGE